MVGCEPRITRSGSSPGIKAKSRLRISKPPPAAYGHSYPIKERDEARFWLMGEPKKGWTVIYNNKGVERLSRPKK